MILQRPELSRTLIGYTEFRTDLPGGRHANVATMRSGHRAPTGPAGMSWRVS